MTSSLDSMIKRIHELQDQLEAEFEKQRAGFRYRVERGRVVFEADVRARHRELRERLLSFLSRTRPMVVLTAPLIYSLIIPIALLDLFVTVYQAVCFRVYGVKRVARRDYVFLDRHQLGYLNGLQKLNCVYCGYSNGVIGYAREIAARTEQYWCPIKNSRRLVDPHPRYPGFVAFGDAEAYPSRVAEQRRALRNEV